MLPESCVTLTEAIASPLRLRVPAPGGVLNVTITSDLKVSSPQSKGVLLLLNPEKLVAFIAVIAQEKSTDFVGSFASSKIQISCPVVASSMFFVAARQNVSSSARAIFPGDWEDEWVVEVMKIFFIFREVLKLPFFRPRSEEKSNFRLL